MVSVLRILAGIAGLASGAKVFDRNGVRSNTDGSSAGAGDGARTIVHEVDGAPGRTVVVCNAFAHAKSLSIFNERTHRLLTPDGALGYKSCRELRTSLVAGDRLDFRLGNASVGIFRATDVPPGVSSLLLVPHRRYAGSLTAAFESHAFADAGSPQVAIVDTYRGKEASKVMIMDAQLPSSDKQKEEPKQQRVEELRFNSVVALGPGSYQVSLQADDKQEIAKVPMTVGAEQANYVVMRTGLQNPLNATAAPAFPQELIVYTQRHSSRSAAGGLRPRLLAAALVVLAAAAL